MNRGRFKFSLEAPLKVKKIEKRRLEKELANALWHMKALDKKLKALEYEERDLYLKLKDSMVVGISAKKLKEINQYIFFLRERLERSRDEHLKAKQKYQELQGDMIRLSNEIDVLEKLKKEKRRDFLIELGKQEEKVLEDNVIYKTMVQGGKIYG